MTSKAFPNEKVLKAIQDLTRVGGTPPTLRELASFFGLRSVSGIQYRLKTLQLEGRVTWEPGRARSLRVLTPGRSPSLETFEAELLAILNQAERDVDELTALGFLGEATSLRTRVEALKQTGTSHANR